MKTKSPLVLIVLMAVCPACSEKPTRSNDARADSESKARAEAARKEMETLPQAFRPRYNKRLEPETVPAKSEKQEKKP